MRKRLSAAMLVTLLLSAVAAGLADARAIGNPQAIAVARAVHRAYEKARSETFVTTGDWVIHDRLNPDGSGQLRWRWSLGYVPRGWAPASAHAVMALQRDHIAWMVVDVFPHCRSTCRDVSARFVLDKTGLFVALGSPPRTCFGKVSAFPWHVGEPWFEVGGRYGPPAYGNGVVVLTHYGKWNKQQTITETLTVSSKTKLPTSVVGRVSRGGRRHPAFTIRSVVSHPTRPVRLPSIHRC